VPFQRLQSSFFILFGSLFLRKDMLIKRMPRQSPVPRCPDFGVLVKTMREECGLSQIELAKMVGFQSATAISLIESGQRHVSAKTLWLIAETCAYRMSIKPSPTP
jgi:DNA-binding XRE family transcriptional regulator